MLIPISWLKKYVNISITPSELAHQLTMAGTEIGAINQIGDTWGREKIIVGQVIKIDAHPNADRLSLPTVDIGDNETHTVVCGAPNLDVGQKIAFAKAGASLMNIHTGRIEELKPTKIRGVMSSGMICSKLELGLGEDHTGILVLDSETPIGTPLVDSLGDTILDAEVTPNRPDCLSVLGIAHEISAITSQNLIEPDLSYPSHGKQIDSQISIKLDNEKLVKRYTASLIHNIKVEPSPMWLQNVLTKAGQRPINNIVDITNYVMLEYGQPLHAFDLDKINGDTIFVREAFDKEVLVTLDGERRELTPGMLIIADSCNPIGLAGIIGGEETAVGSSTKSILIESANFNATNVRRTRSILKVSTGASYRFERGIRPELAPLALKRASQLITQITGGNAAQGIIDLYPGETSPPTFSTSQKHVKQVLGIDIPVERIRNILASLGFELVDSPNKDSHIGSQVEANVRVKAPYWRSDITIENDLIEEIARIIGYDNIPNTPISTPIPNHEPNYPRIFREQMRDILVSSGMDEIISYPLTSKPTLDAVSATADHPEPFKISNPMSSDMHYLRTSLRGSLLETLSYNRRISQREGIRIFEIARIYLPSHDPKEKILPHETEMIVGVLSGPRLSKSWLGSNSNLDFFDAKGILESAFDKISLRIKYIPSSDDAMHPGKTAALLCNTTHVGVMGELHPKILEYFNLEDFPVILFELSLDNLHKMAEKTSTTYSPVSRFPESERDWGLIVNTDISSDTIQTIIERHKLVIRTTPLDIYTGQEIPAGKKSVTYRVVFQSSMGTLTTEEINKTQNSILRQLIKEVQATLRE